MGDAQNRARRVLIVVVALLVLLAITSTFIMGFWSFPRGMMGRGMMGPWWMMGWGSRMQWGYNPMVSIVAAFVPIALLVLIGVGAYCLLAGRTREADVRRATPVEILKERYAKGEITHEDFLRMKEQLSA